MHHLGWLPKRQTIVLVTLVSVVMFSLLSINVKVAHASAITDYVNGNWGGYTITTKTTPQISDTIAVRANWDVPQISCYRNGYPISGTMGVWVGLGGVHTGLVQAGTAGICQNGQAIYKPFYTFNAVPTYIGNTISPYDTMYANVTEQGYGYYVIQLYDLTRHWNFSYIRLVSFSQYRADTAEWIVEDSGAGTFPQFGYAYLSGVQYSGNSNYFSPYVTGSNLTRDIIGSYIWYTGGWGSPYKATTFYPQSDGQSFYLTWNLF